MGSIFNFTGKCDSWCPSPTSQVDAVHSLRRKIPMSRSGTFWCPPLNGHKPRCWWGNWAVLNMKWREICLVGHECHGCHGHNCNQIPALERRSPHEIRARNWMVCTELGTAPRLQTGHGMTYDMVTQRILSHSSSKVLLFVVWNHG